MKDENKKKNTLDREEFGYGYDLSPDDLDIRGKNKIAKKSNDYDDKEKPINKNNPSRLNL
ncbi:hypothetical protein [Psychrobacillus sp.]|uniref:hypothetical protein n=1 Tax=Psychrobacillus sp. TaxID=1871623 RepID=UPI0028BEA134|nr:hypothetical protein [Psychrobacillus sp.]